MMTHMRIYVAVTLLASFILSTGCGDDDASFGDADASPEDTDGGDDADASIPSGDDYVFDSRFQGGESSVAYSGQALRQVLMNDLNAYISALSTTAPEDFPEDVLADLNFYYEFDALVGGEAPLLLTTDPSTLQATYGAIGSANLRTKIAGEDAMGQHKDWTTEFEGWPGGDATSPHLLVQFYFEQIDALANAFAAGNAPDDPDGNQIDSAVVSADGRDYRQLAGKFLMVAVAYSQATDDYWDDDLDDHGINVDNEVAFVDGEEEKPYTQLEHYWDEGFGYFGAARDYLDYTDEELEGIGGREDYQKYHDTDGDEAIDLGSEYVFSWANYAARRDNGSAPTAPTDFTADIFEALLEGRTIITSAGGALSESEMSDLQEQRDAAVAAWDKLIAANVVYYINGVLKDMATFDTEPYDFVLHAGHWSEAKAFALGLQFNPRKEISDLDFVMLHELLGDAPVLPNADSLDIAAYKQALLDARALLGDTYGFDAANLGDDDGQNGW